MDNSQNKSNGNKNGEGNSRKKPYYKHHRRKPSQNKQGMTSAPEQVSAGGSISVRPGRYDLPPAEAEKVQVNEAQPKKDEPRRDRTQNHRPHHHRRGEKKHNKEGSVQSDVAEAPVSAPAVSAPQKTVADAFTAELDSLLGNTPATVSVHKAEEAKVSEYVTTAGSVDTEVIDELNSVSENDIEFVGSSVEEKTDLATYEIVGIRFKAGGKIYYFSPNGIKAAKGMSVIVETARGLEYGICEIANRTVTEREVILPLRNVVRIATKEDTVRHEQAAAKEKEAFTVCAEKIAEHKLGMKLIDVEYAFDGSKILFYFTAEGRVDFRELVKDLAAVFRTRIELRQIGIRDETKLLGGIGICGRPFCCKTFLSDFVQVSIKMAKEQNLSLNSVKISGACGRLMCCLRYEYDTYQEEIKRTPKVDQIVRTADGDGTVIEVQPLAGLVRVRFGTKAEMIPPKVYHRDDVKVIGGKGFKPSETAE